MANGYKRKGKGNSSSNTNQHHNRRSSGSSRSEYQRDRSYIKRNPRNYQDDAEIAEKNKYLKREKTNDGTWYTRFPQLAKDATQFQYANPAGTTIQAVTPNSLNQGNENFTTGGVYINYLVPSIGYSTTAKSAANKAATALFNAVRREQTGSPTFEQTDLFMYVLAVGELYSYIMWLQRLYGTVDLTPLQNLYMPSDLIQAQGVDYADIRNNRVTFRNTINNLITYAVEFRVPADLALFRRKAFVYSAYYIDSQDLKGSLYFNAPAGFYMWAEGNASENIASKLEAYRLSVNPNNIDDTSKLLKVSDLDRIGFQMIERMRQSGSIQFMSSAIEKLLGSGATMNLITLPEFYPVTPIYDPVVLQQFKNTTASVTNFMELTSTLPGFKRPPLDNVHAMFAFPDVTQSVNVGSTILISEPYFFNPTAKEATSGSPAIANVEQDLGNFWINFRSHKAIVSCDGDRSDPKLIMDITRFTSLVSMKRKEAQTGVTGLTGLIYPYYCGTELVVGAVMLRPSGAPVSGEMRRVVPASGLALVAGPSGVTSVDAAVLKKLLNGQLYLAVNGRYDYSPACLVMAYNAGNRFADVIDMHFDMDEFAMINYEMIDQLNYVALSSLMTFGQ